MGELVINSLLWGMSPVPVRTRVNAPRKAEAFPPSKEHAMTTMLSSRGRDIMISALCGLAGVVLTSGTLLAIPMQGATDSPRQPTLECRLMAPGLEAPCRPLAEVNPSVV